MLLSELMPLHKSTKMCLQIKKYGSKKQEEIFLLSEAQIVSFF